ncbi:MAG TPA: patatin-like phospholipase family protein, partial [Usitatibacter sp.]|nr:patatin-like phospholipase family protein [Usitatibacter sp.]
RWLAAVAAALLLAVPASAGNPARVAAPAADCPAPAVESSRAERLPALPGLRVGLALGSGSIHGLAHIGVIEALEARGVKVQVVAGTSVGALVGSLWASGMSGPDIESLAKTLDFAHLGEFVPSWQGLMSNDDLRSRMARELGARPIQAWPRRFGAVAANLDNGARRVLDSGDGAIAVQASTAMPVYFAPVTVEGERLGDGALVEPVPVRTARELGADYVIAVDVAYRPYDAPASGLLQNGFQAMHILVNSLAETQMRAADFPIRIDAHHTMTECGTQALVAAGRDAVARQWPALRASLLAAQVGSGAVAKR